MCAILAANILHQRGNVQQPHAMKTVVYQSYRTTNVSPWITACMQTVRAWAAANHFDYQFIDDRLFDYAPAWFRDKAAPHICPVTDLARLVLARQLLAQGYERTVWVDADMVVFAPERLTVDVGNDFAFCHEVWLATNQDKQVGYVHNVNNSITIFTQGSATYLDFFIDACQRVALNRPELGKLDVGTLFLTQLRSVLPFRLLGNVGMFSPHTMQAIADGTEQYLRTYGQALKTPLACANLCGSLLGQQTDGITTDDRFYSAVVEKCMQTQGDVVNRFIGVGQPT